MRCRYDSAIAKRGGIVRLFLLFFFKRKIRMCVLWHTVCNRYFIRQAGASAIHPVACPGHAVSIAYVTLGTGVLTGKQLLLLFISSLCEFLCVLSRSSPTSGRVTHCNCLERVTGIDRYFVLNIHLHLHILLYIHV